MCPAFLMVWGALCAEVRKSECAKFEAIDQIPSHDECGVPQHPDTMRYYAEALRNKFKDKYEERLVCGQRDTTVSAHEVVCSAQGNR